MNADRITVRLSCSRHPPVNLQVVAVLDELSAVRHEEEGDHASTAIMLRTLVIMSIIG
jgi:hypothetical protein